MESINFSRATLIADSSQLRKLSFDPNEKRMRVQFVNGDIYEYFNVNPNVYGGIVAAESAGAAFNKFKGQLTKFVKVG